MNEDSIKKFYENTKRINPSFNMEYDDFCDRMQDPISRKKFYENTRKLNPAFRISDEEADAILGFTTSDNQQQEPKQSFGSKLLQNAGPFVPAGGTVYGLALAEKKEQERQAEEEDKREKERRHQAAITIGITDKDNEQMAQRDALSQKVNAESVKMFTPTLSYTPFNEDGSFNPLGMKKTESEEYNQAKKDLEEFERNMPSYLTRGEKTAEDIFTNAAERFRNTEEGKKAADEITQKYVEEFLQSEDFQRVRNNGEEAVYKEFNRLYEDRINTEYSEMVQSVMKDYIEDANERLGIKNTDNSIVGLDRKLQVLRTKSDEYIEFTNVSEKDIQERYTQEHGSTMQQDIKDPAAVMAIKQAYYEKIHNEKVEEALERGMVPVNGNTLRHAEAYINKSKELIDAVKNDKGFFKAMGNTLSDIDTWSMGLTEIGRNLDVMNICKKVDENGGDLDVLSEDEQALLESVTTYMATCAYYSPQLNRAYKAGQTTAASIPFMLSIMLGSGFTKAAGQGFVKVLGKVAERMLGKYVEKQSIKVAGKVAGKAVETLVRSEIMTATFGAPRVAAGTIDRMTGDIGFRFSNDGKIEYDGREGQQGFGEALWNSHADTFIEYWSEDAFRILDPLGVAIKGSKWFGNIARKAEGNYILQDIIKLRNQPWLRNLRESTQFQSFPEEVLEEELGGILRIISTTDTKVKNEDGTTNWEQTWKNAGLDIDSQIDIVLGLAPTSLFMGGIGAAGFYGGRSINYANFEKNLSSEEDKKLFKQIMKETRSGEFAEGAHALIRNILANDNLSVEQKREMILDVSSQYYKVMSDELHGMYRQTQVEPIIEATQHEGSDVIFNTTDDKGRKVCIVGGKLQFKQQDTDNGPVDMLDKENSDDKVYVRVYGDDGSISKVYEVDASTLTNPITNISNSDMREFLNAQKHALFNGDKTFAVGDDTFNTDTGELIESNKPDNADTETGGNVPDGGGQQVEQDAETNELEGYLQPVNTRPHIINRQFEIRMPNGTTRTVRITSRSVALKEDGTIDEKRSSFAIRNEKDKIILGDEKQQCLDAINAILLSERNAEIEQARQKKADDEAARASKTQGSEAERKVAGEVAGEAQEVTAPDGQKPDGASGVQDDVTPTPAAQEEGVAPVQDDGPTPSVQQEQGEQQDEQPSEPTEEEQWNAAVAETTSMQKSDGTFKPDATPEHKVVAIIGADKTGMQDAVDVAKAEIADIDNSLSTIDGNKRLSATDRLFRKRKLTDERQAWIDAIRKYVGEEAASSLETPTAHVAQETPVAVEGTQSADNVQNNTGVEQASQENVQETVGDVSMDDIEGAPVAQSQSGNEEIISETDAATILKQIEDEAEEAEEIELTPENWYAQFGEDGIVETPIGKVKMGEHQYLKLAQKGREGKLGMIKPTLERPTIIIEDKSKANDGQKTERESSFVFVKAFVNKSGERIYYFTSVTVMKDGQEVVVSNQEKRKSVITNFLNKGNLVWKHADNVSSVSDITNGLYSSQGVKTSDPTIEGTDAPHTKTLSSADKGSENNPNDQTFDEENAEKVENASENGVSAGVPINPMSSEYALVRTSNNRVEWARVGMDEAGNPILDEAGNPVYYSLNTNKPIKRTAIDKNIVYLKDANEGYQPYVLMSIIKPQDIKHHTRNTFRLMDMNGNILDVNSNQLFYQEEGSEEYVPAVESKKNTDTPDSILNTLIYNFKKGGAYRLSDLVKEGFTNIGRGRYITPYDKLMQRIANETGLKGVELADVTRSVNSVLNEAISRWNRMVELRGYDEQLANSTGLDHNVMTSMYGDKRSLIIGNRFRKGTDTQNVDNPACQLVAAVDMAQQMGLIEEGTFNVAGYNALRYSIPKKWLSKSDAKNEKEAAKATYDELAKQYNTLKKQRDALQKQLDDNPDMPYMDSEVIKGTINKIKNQMNDVADEMDMLDGIRMQRTSYTQHATSEQVNAVAEQLQKAMPNTEVVVAQDMEEATAFMSERTGMSEEELREELGDGTVAGASLPDGSVVLVADSVRMDTAFHEFAHKLYAFAKENGGPLLDAINKYIEQAPQAIKDYVSSHYPDAVGTDAYLDEVFAWALSEQSGKKIEQFLAERGLGSNDVMENMRHQAWYSRMWNAIKRLWNSIKTEFSDRFGSKYADLSVFDAYQTMSAEEIGNNLYDTLMGGKELAVQKNAKKSSKDLVNSKKKRNFAIVKSGKSNRLAINITQNAGEDRSANRLGELNEQDRLDYKDALSELRRTDITDEERKAAEDTIERIQSIRKEQMRKLVEEALKGIEGVRVAGISEGTGVYLNGEEEVIEYTSQVDLDVEEGQEDAVVAAMAMIAEVTKQDSFIVNYPDGITDKGWHSQQVHITTENPLTKQQVAKLSDEFTKHDLGVTIIGNEIYTGNFDDNLSNDDFVRIVNQIIEKFYKDGNAETSIRSTRNSQENVQELDGIPFILGEQSLDGNTMLGTCKIKARVNYSSFNAAKNEEDEYGNSKYLDRYGNETATDRYYGEYYGGSEEEGSIEHPIQNTSITSSDLRKRLQGALISSDFSIEKKRIIERAKADGTYMKAPNGKPSNLSEDLWAGVRTKSFKRWFGDWEKDPENASKVVDENGEPLVVYHGSRHAGFDMFMLNGRGSQGIYTTDSRDAANTYATNVSERRNGVQQGDAIIGASEHHGIYPLFVNMKDPKRFDFGGREWDRYGEEHYIVMSDADELGDTPIFDTEEEANEYARTQGGEENGYYVLPKYTTSDELLIETLQDGAYDGCVFTNYKDGHPRGEAITSYVPFSSNQLKSSTQNSGEFGLQDDRINHQRVGSRGTGKKRTAKSLFSKKVPNSEIAVARKALFEAMFGQRKLYNPIGVYSANYYHVFQNNSLIGSILIEGNEEDISTLNKLFNNGTYEDANEFSKVIEGIRSGQKLSDSHDFVHEKSGRGNAGTDKLHNQQVRAGKSGDSKRDRGKVSRVDSAVSTRGRRGGGIRLQVTGGGYDLITDGGVPKNELAVANKALFELRYGNRRTERFIDVYSANYWHIFDGNKRIGSIQIEGNEDLIKTYKEALHGIDTSRERPDDIIEAIRGRAWDYNRTDADVTQQGGGNDTTNPNVAEQKDGTRRDNSKGVGTIRASSRIRLQVTGGGYYSNSDFVPVDPKKAEAIKKKSEDMKHAVKTAMRKPSVVSKKTAAWLAAKTAATLDRTEGVRRLDYSLDEWLKANGRKGTHMRYNVRQRIEAANSTIRYRVQQLEKKELRHLNEVIRNLVKEVEGSAMYNKYKIEKQPDVYGEQIYLTPVQFIERYLISRDNMERYDMGIDRGLKEFQERMGVDMATFMEEFERTYFSGKEGEAKRMELWNAIRDVTDISLNESLDSGIISEEAYNKMMNRKFYVPERDYAAKHDEDDSDGVVKRRGRKKLKPASIATKAEGGNSLADNVLAHIMDDAIDSITKAEKNRVKLCMYKMLTENKEWCREIGIPIPTEVFYVKNEDGTYSRKDNAPTADERIAYAETMQTINELKNELLTTSDESVKEAIKSEIQKLEASLQYIDAATASKLFVEDAKNSLSSVCVMVDGVANEMIFPHMEYVADALNDRFNKSGQIDIIKKITGFIAAQFTVNNPTFFAVNICRDVPYVLQKGATEYGFEFQARFTRNFAMSQRAVWRYLTNKETLDKETSQMLQNFLDSGGQMGYSNIPNIYDMKASVEALNEEGELRQKDGAYYASMVLSLGTARLANTLNDWSEIITRFSAYKSVIEMGLGHEEAMKASANLSCNFNRRGLGNTFFNFFSSLSMFVNAAVQGASSFYRSFDTIKHAARGFFNLMLGPAFFGFLSTLLSPDDDDEEFAISDFDRDNYFCLGNWRIPLNEQLKPFWVIGVNIALGMRGRRDSSEIANSIISSLVRNLLPLPQNITNTAIMFTDFATGDKDEWNLGKAINSMFMPEALKTSVQLAQNENFLGNKIRYNTGDRPQIDFDDNEAQLYQDVCELFYLLGGGKEGSHSLTREDGSKVKFDFGAKELKQYMFVVPQGTQDMLLSAYGIGKASVQSVLDDVPMSDALKENVRWRDVPIVNRFYHPIDSALFRYSVKKEATSLVNDRRIVIENTKREVKRYSKMKEDATNSGNLELAAEMNDALESEIRKLNNVLTKEYKILEELVDNYNKINYANVAKKSLNMNEKEFKKKFPDIDYENIDDNLKNLASSMLTFMYIMDGNERIDKKIPDMIRGKLDGSETVKEYFDKKKVAGE